MMTIANSPGESWVNRFAPVKRIKYRNNGRLLLGPVRLKILKIDIVATDMAVIKVSDNKQVIIGEVPIAFVSN